MITPHCSIHKYHSPMPLLYEEHHIQPLGMGGKDVAANKVWVCVQGHYNIHELLGDLLRSGTMRRGGGRAERACANQGFAAWVAAGKPGRPVYGAVEAAR